METKRISVRFTCFIKKPVAFQQSDIVKLMSELQEYKIFFFPVKGVAFSITPDGIKNVPFTNYQAGNEKSSIKLNFSPDRIDLVLSDEILDKDVVNICTKIFDVLYVNAGIEVNRCAVASSEQLLLAEEKDLYTNFGGCFSEEMVEWSIRKVKRNVIQDIFDVPINFVTTLTKPDKNIAENKNKGIIFNTDYNTLGNKRLFSQNQVQKFFAAMYSKINQEVNNLENYIKC